MADIFDLAPEGQAWTDNLSADNAAKPEDYDPSFFAGSLSALPRGAAEGAIGLGQTITGFGKDIISDQKTMLELAPTYGILKSMFPGAAETLNSAYDTTAKSLEASRQAIKPDSSTQGTAATVLNELGKFIPAIGSTVIGGPVTGGSVAFGSTFEPVRQDFLKKGVDAETATTLATEQATFSALGMALPVAAGGNLATRLLSGIGINTTFGGVNRFAMSETLDENGYSDMAKQYKVWDKQAIAIDAVLGAAFAGAHHLSAARNASPDIVPELTPESAPTPNDGTTVPPESPDSSVGDAPIVDAPPAANYDTRIAELQGLAENLLPVGERKALAAEIHQAEYSLSQLEAQRQALRDQRVGNSSSRRIRNRDMGELDRQVQEINTRIEPQRQALADSSRGGQFFEAKADLSRIEQGIIPESMRDFVQEGKVKPSDVDAAHVLNEGLHYDIESSPVVHGTTESVNAHVAAMDSATRSLMDGEPVNVSQQIRGLDGVIRPDAAEAGRAQQEAITEALNDSGVPLTPRSDADIADMPLNESSAFGAAREDSGQVSVDPDTGEVISSNNFDLLTARDIAADAEARVLHPDTGEEVSLSQALADLDEQINTVQRESDVYSIAAACFLRNPS
ncbi:hypothetical protein LLS47_12320 [Rouxiella badensis]|uniref:hypothetical protein n=1 Tax=Rouxiella badensis TaxID=1646377 RepID=UPI001D147244|nr:hypothetical protein [Rouxiella badensis]MCC3733713.1 hypothetical protein [Rouxiella badensis]MCC3759634.1 hypothetical protein [Rouxiella badensis]